MHEVETNTVDPSASSPGAILKRCREYHGLTLEEAEEATKIGANYLAALEGDQISQFASLAYLKGFLRIYASYLGLNPDDMIRLYDKLYSSGGDRNEQKKEVKNGSKAPGRRIPLQKLALPAIILVLILITSAIVNRTPSPPSRPDSPLSPAPQPSMTTTVQQASTSARHVPPPVKADPTTPEKSRTESAASQPAPLRNSPDNTKGIIVRLKVTQGGTMSVTIDGSGSQAYDLAVGDNIEWKADRTITLELSNAGGVEAELNGKQLKSFGPTGKPAVVVLDSEGVRQ